MTEALVLIAVVLFFIVFYVVLAIVIARAARECGVILNGVSHWARRQVPASPPPAASAAPNRCRCGYDLRGNASGVCPECGVETWSLG